MSRPLGFPSVGEEAEPFGVICPPPVDLAPREEQPDPPRPPTRPGWRTSEGTGFGAVLAIAATLAALAEPSWKHVALLGIVAAAQVGYAWARSRVKGS